jgi:pimeloyl-ACP methyl ester carboxylesterase
VKQPGAGATFVLVHGCWAGGWFWRRLAPILEEAGHSVFAPTLTGLGDRSHLASPAVNLSTHAWDVAALLEFEDLRDVILVGHSYAGMVVAAVAEQVPERLSQVIFLDGCVPRDGESLADLMPPEMMSAFRFLVESEGDGWRLPLPIPLEAFGVTGEDLSFMTRRMVDQPFQTILEPVRLGNGAAAAIPRAFISCTRLATGILAKAVKRARDGGFQFLELDVTHLGPFTDPAPIARALQTLAASSG